MVNTGASLGSDYEKRKEDAINRIIRNERIKQIRIKMHEYELLKEYQTCNNNQHEQESVLGAYQTHDSNNEDLFNTTTTSGENNDDNDEFELDNSNTNNKARKIHSKSKSSKCFSLNNYGAFLNNPVSQDLNDDYELDDNEESGLNDDNSYLTLNKVIPENSNSNSIKRPNKLSDYSLPSDEYKAKLGFYMPKTNEATFDEYKNENYFEDNEENYESGIEDDDFSMSAPKYSKQKQRHNMSRNFASSLNVKPGYELYQIGGGLFNLSSSQSTFQLKVSIISAEVKNIVNVLKQV
jgi:hypothetical protein